MEYWKCVPTSNYTRWHADKNTTAHVSNEFNPRVSVATQISGCTLEVPMHSYMCNRSLPSLHKVSTTRALSRSFCVMQIVLSKHPIGLPLLPMCAFVHILTLGRHTADLLSYAHVQNTAHLHNTVL